MGDLYDDISASPPTQPWQVSFYNANVLDPFLVDLY